MLDRAPTVTAGGARRPWRSGMLLGMIGLLDIRNPRIRRILLVGVVVGLFVGMLIGLFT